MLSEAKAPSLNPESLADIESYEDYWLRFKEASLAADPYDIREAKAAERANATLQTLGVRLNDPSTKVHEKFVDSLRPQDVAAEWYLGLGTMNNLKGAERPLTFAFIRLWRGAYRGRSALDDMTAAYRQAIVEISSVDLKAGHPSELIRNIADDPQRANYAILAGNVLLDAVRATPPAERNGGHMLYLDLVEKLNGGIAQRLAKHDQLENEHQGQLSDAIKYKHEAIFERILTQWATGKIDEATYKKAVAKAVVAHMTEVEAQSGDRDPEDHRIRNSKLALGDINEHYFTGLLRYTTTLFGDNRYVIRAATKREDKPHDHFIGNNLPAYSFDVKLDSITSEATSIYVQLKNLVSGKNKLKYTTYASGIRVVEDFVDGSSDEEAKENTLAGMRQLRGLIFESHLGKSYSGDVELFFEHLQRVQDALEDSNEVLV